MNPSDHYYYYYYYYYHSKKKPTKPPPPRTATLSTISSSSSLNHSDSTTTTTSQYDEEEEGGEEEEDGVFTHGEVLTFHVNFDSGPLGLDVHDTKAGKGQEEEGVVAVVVAKTLNISISKSRGPFHTISSSSSSFPSSLPPI